MTRKYKAYAQIGKEVLDLVMLAHHIVFADKRIHRGGRKNRVVGKCDYTLTAFFCGFGNFLYPVPVLLGIAAFALAVFIGIESKQNVVAVKLGGIGQLKL